MQQGSLTMSAVDTLTDLLLGPIRWNIVQVALEVELFEQVKDWQSYVAVADALNFAAVPTALLLDALCSLGLLKKRQDSYKLEASAATFLRADSEQSMLKLLPHLASIRSASVEQIKQVLATGVANHDAVHYRDAGFWQKKVEFLSQYQHSVGSAIALDILNPLPEWPKAKRMLDLSAGSEALSLALLKQRPDLDVCLFDLPDCAEQIKQRLDGQTGTQVIAGDINTASIGDNYDVIWASMCLYYANDLECVLKKIKQALSANGVFVSYHEALQQGRTQPEAHISGRFVSAICGHDMSFNDGEIAEKMQQAGFTRVESRMVNSPFGPMRVDIARV